MREDCLKRFNTASTEKNFENEPEEEDTADSSSD
jgi:hypothetical protein